jgi:hypothetical protein
MVGDLGSRYVEGVHPVDRTGPAAETSHWRHPPTRRRCSRRPRGTGCPASCRERPSGSAARSSFLRAGPTRPARCPLSTEPGPLPTAVCAWRSCSVRIVTRVPVGTIREIRSTLDSSPDSSSPGCLSVYTSSPRSATSASRKLTRHTDPILVIDTSPEVQCSHCCQHCARRAGTWRCSHFSWFSSAAQRRSRRRHPELLPPPLAPRRREPASRQV